MSSKEPLPTSPSPHKSHWLFIVVVNSKSLWYFLCMSVFLYLWTQVHANPEKDDDYGPLPPEPEPVQKGQQQEELQDDGKVKGHWDKRLTSFQKLMFIKVFKEEKVGALSIVSVNYTNLFCECVNLWWDVVNGVHCCIKWYLQICTEQ